MLTPQKPFSKDNQQLRRAVIPLLLNLLRSSSGVFAASWNLHRKLEELMLSSIVPSNFGHTPLCLESRHETTKQSS